MTDDQGSHHIIGPPQTGDRQRVQAMHDANWKPAATYWRERAMKAEATLAAAPQPVPWYEDQHRFAVVSSDYSRPFLLGAYPTLPNAVKAQCGSPEKWHIFERHSTAPQPAPADREALVEVIREARMAWANDGDGESCPDEAIADALLARGLRLPVNDHP